MNESRPSVAVAIWLLQHVGGSNPREDALTRDLLESMAEGQTAGWLVREVSIAIAHRLSKKIRVYWQELGTVALGTTIALSSADAQWRGQWVDFMRSSLIEHHPRWTSFAGHSLAIEATYGAALLLLLRLLILRCGRMPAWRSLIPAIPITYVLLAQVQLTFLLLVDPAPSFFDLGHLLILGCNAATLFLALLTPNWISTRKREVASA
jgi:hypothetical protein